MKTNFEPNNEQLLSFALGEIPSPDDQKISNWILSKPENFEKWRDIQWIHSELKMMDQNFFTEKKKKSSFSLAWSYLAISAAFVIGLMVPTQSIFEKIDRFLNSNKDFEFSEPLSISNHQHSEYL